jgi:hypothetical protein
MYYSSVSASSTAAGRARLTKTVLRPTKLSADVSWPN